MAAAANLTEAQRERLEMLAEEAGEVVQAVTKILRHGYDSFNPFDDTETSNRDLLAKELLDLQAVATAMGAEGDVDWRDDAYSERAGARWQQKLAYTHHQSRALTPAERHPELYDEPMSVRLRPPGRVQEDGGPMHGVLAGNPVQEDGGPMHGTHYPVDDAPRPDPNEKIWLADMTCLVCGKGAYPGYNGRRTLPCPECGDTQPGAMRRRQFRDAVRRRDAKLKETPNA